MAKNVEKPKTAVATPELQFGKAWNYAPAPESTDHFTIAPRHELFVGGARS